MLALERFISFTLVLVTTCHAAASGHIARSLRFEAPPVEPRVVLPLSFDQQLLVCNAYPGSSPVTVRLNEKEPIADQQGIRFQECRQMSARVHSKDKLDFNFPATGIQGTFEIGELPDTNALLLLVVEKRDAVTPLVSFQSFAFPSHSEGKTAQLAIIDTYKGDSISPHLRMEDDVNMKETRTISKRVEQLSFNHIYAIEEGNFVASISDHILDNQHGLPNPKKTFRLAKKTNYVILRTGGGEFHQSLVVYPEQLPRSSTCRLFSSLVGVLLVVLSVSQL